MTAPLAAPIPHARATRPLDSSSTAASPSPTNIATRARTTSRSLRSSPSPRRVFAPGVLDPAVIPPPPTATDFTNVRSPASTLDNLHPPAPDSTPDSVHPPDSVPPATFRCLDSISYHGSNPLEYWSPGIPFDLPKPPLARPHYSRLFGQLGTHYLHSDLLTATLP